MYRLALLRDPEGLDAKTVRQMGWSETKNGALLNVAAEHFEVFVTVDKNLSFQQNLTGMPLCVVVLATRTSRLADLRSLVRQLRALLPTLARGEVRLLRPE